MDRATIGEQSPRAASQAEPQMTIDIANPMHQTRTLLTQSLAASAVAVMLFAPICYAAPTLDDMLGLPAEKPDPAFVGEQTPDEGWADKRDGHIAPPASDPAPIELDDEVRWLLDEDAPPDVYQQTLRDMRKVAQRLAHRYDHGLQTQRIQASIIEKFEQILAEAVKQQRQSSSPSPSSSSSGQQQQDTGSSANASRDGQQGPPGPSGQQGAIAQGNQQGGKNAAGNASGDGPDAQPGGPMQTNRDEWGSLPPRLREQLQQGFNEPYSAVYRSITEQYYRRLGQEGR